MKWFPRIAAALWIFALLGGCSVSPEGKSSDKSGDDNLIYVGRSGYVGVRHWTDPKTGCEYLTTVYVGFSATTTPRLGTKCAPAPVPTTTTY